LKIPKKINVAGVNYRVKLHHPVISPTGEAVWGFVNFGTCVIEVDSKLAPDKQKSVLMHEIIHAIDDAVGLEFSEEVTDRVAVAVVDVITRNKLDLNG
jgi:hypothetical protein